MSHSSFEDDQRKVALTSRMWVESQPGPSRCHPNRQGYCGYCRVLYNNLDQHLSSLRHLDSVQLSSRCSASGSSTWSNQTKVTLLERFLQDVLQHHPHRYNDPRPSHDDLPSASTLPLPRAELDELCFCDDDSKSLGTQEHLLSSDDAVCVSANQEEDNDQSGERIALNRPVFPIRKQKDEGTVSAGHMSSSQLKSLSPHTQTLPSVHRKAHRKTNRRKPSDTSSSSQGPRVPIPQPHHKQSLGPNTCERPWAQFKTVPRPQTLMGSGAWLSWQRERREVQKEETFSSEHTDPLEQTIEEVIQMCCYSIRPSLHQQDDAESLHLSLSVSMETQSEDWDSPVQGFFQRARTLAKTPVQVSQVEGQSIKHLMDIQVDMEDQVYANQLDSALLGGGIKQDEGFWSLPIEKVFPVPDHIPESFRGKTWAQIEGEDEEKVEKLVQQFRRGKFICYFDTESLARYGRRSHVKKRLTETKEAEPDIGALPLIDQGDDESTCTGRRKRRSCRLASRCQVVKVSHSTQTVHLVVPTVHQLSPESPPAAVPAAIQRTPEMQTWRCLPPLYSNIVTPVQPRTSLVYFLCSSSGSTPTSPEGSTPKRCRRRRRPVDLQGVKVKYKRLPVQFYEPGTNRILKKPPKGLLWYRGSTSSGPPSPCVRQLFRSLSPDLNSEKQPGKEPKVDAVPLSMLSRDTAENVRRRGRTSQATPLHSRSEQERGGRRGLLTSKRRNRVQAPLPLPRREGLRRAASVRKLPDASGPAYLPTRRKKGQRGRGSQKGGR